MKKEPDYLHCMLCNSDYRIVVANNNVLCMDCINKALQVAEIIDLKSNKIIKKS